MNKKDRFEVYEVHKRTSAIEDGTESREFGFRQVSHNGRIISSAKGYDTRSGARDGVIRSYGEEVRNQIVNV
jgi:uncharacterized protein YegP (UPF0339 family)